MRDIGTSQDEERNLRRQLAKAHYYAVAKRQRFVGASFAIVLALGSPLVLLYRPSLGPLLGAIAGAWIFVSRLVLEPWKQRFQAKGAAAQELFDCDVLGLPWNDALVVQPSEEEIRSASKTLVKPRMIEKHRGWYPAQVEIDWPKSVITCQRANAVWARRQHRGYGIALLIAASGWGIAGIAVAVIHGAALAEYLTTIALPSLPAMLDAAELSKGHMQASTKRQMLEDETNSLLGTSQVSNESLREIQDQLFGLRRDAPIVAGWFYRMVAAEYEEDMKYAAEMKAYGKGP